MDYKGIGFEDVLKKIKIFLSEDCRWENVYNSICSKPLEIGKEAFNQGIETNLGDKRIFKGTEKVEEIVIKKLGRLLDSETCVGNIVSGGTEANFLALYVAKKMRESVLTPEIIVSDTVHFSVLKATEFLGIKCRFIRSDEKYKLNVSEIEENINKNTIAIVATAGTSEFGSVDDIEEIAKIASVNKIYFHVDAATGGFIIPFARMLGKELPNVSFSIAGVSSITIDPHKYGLVPIPSGAILFQDKSLQDKIHLSSYFVGTHHHTTMLGTRSGAPVLAAFAVIEHLGIEGFLEITKRNFELTNLLKQELEKIGFELYIEPELNIVCIKARNTIQIMEKLESKGIIISVSKRVPDVIRIVVNNHMNEDMIYRLINELRRFKDE